MIWNFASLMCLLARLTLGCSLAMLLVGCVAQPETPQRKPPEVRLGPLLELLNVGSVEDKLRVVDDTADRVHVLIASASLRQVLDIVVGPTGVSGKQVIRSNVVPSKIDGAVDAAGRLHVLIDSEHFVREDGRWHASSSTVWQDAGIKVERPGFASGTNGLVWTFTALGESMGATPARWVWRGGGGGYPAGAFLVFPWREQTRKAVLAIGGAGGDSPWYVLEPGSELDTAIVGSASDSAGTVHLVYARGFNVDLAGTTTLLGGLLTRGPGAISLHYTRVGPDELPEAPARTSNQPTQSGAVRPLRGLAGMRQLAWPYSHTRLPLAVDRATGTALLADRWLVRGDRWADVNTSSPFALGSSPQQIAAAGSDRFHAVALGNIDSKFLGRTGVEYAMLDEGGWSAPLWLSIAGTLSILGSTEIDMSSNRSGNAFVAWSVGSGFVGRWIEHTR